MCRATVGELYVPPEPQLAERVIETRVTTVHVEDFGTQQRTERCRNRSTQLSCISCVIAFIIFITVIIWIMNEN